MRHFQLLFAGLDVLPTLLELQRQPELWDVNEARRMQYRSPHAETSDIWVRWRGDNKLDDGQPFEIQFLPAWSALPSLRPMVFMLMARCQAVQLGAIFITRIPSGCRVLPHIDGGWHANRFNTKIYIPLQTNPDCVNHAEDERVVMRTGDAWMFRNTVQHSVHNGGPDDRISLIVGLRCES